MKEKTARSIILLVMLIADARSDDALNSGLQPGDLATPFEVMDVTGPNKGITLCYR